MLFQTHNPTLARPEPFLTTRMFFLLEWDDTPAPRPRGAVSRPRLPKQAPSASGPDKPSPGQPEKEQMAPQEPARPASHPVAGRGARDKAG